ncbi:hypothetical protein [Bacillus safensis]|uniref:hypothetical protein n=1 Tax=Bacillus safensis TaxID=561879 RepID=UPI0036701892
MERSAVSLVGSFKIVTPAKNFYTVNHTSGTHRIKMTIYKNSNWTGLFIAVKFP